MFKLSSVHKLINFFSTIVSLSAAEELAARHALPGQLSTYYIKFQFSLLYLIAVLDSSSRHWVCFTSVNGLTLSETLSYICMCLILAPHFTGAAAGARCWARPWSTRATTWRCRTGRLRRRRRRAWRPRTCRCLSSKAKLRGGGVYS